MQNKQGFTLIEILVVLVIIGITAGFALLAFGDFGSERRIVIAAEQFVNYVKFVQQEAIFEGSTLGIRIKPDGYQVLRFQAPSNWKILSQKAVFYPHYFPKNTIIRLESGITQKGAPQIIMDASGDMSPFTLIFGSTHHIQIAKVRGEQDGSLSLTLGERS